MLPGFSALSKAQKGKQAGQCSSQSCQFTFHTLSILWFAQNPIRLLGPMLRRISFCHKIWQTSLRWLKIYTTRYEFRLLDELDIQPIQLPSMFVFASKRVTWLLSKHQALSHSFIN